MHVCMPLRELMHVMNQRAHTHGISLRARCADAKHSIRHDIEKIRACTMSTSSATLTKDARTSESRRTIIQKARITENSECIRQNLICRVGALLAANDEGATPVERARMHQGDILGGGPRAKLRPLRGGPRATSGPNKAGSADRATHPMRAL